MPDTTEKTALTTSAERASAEFWFDPRAGLIHVRSASRMGRNDFGVNRARVEAIRARLEAR